MPQLDLFTVKVVTLVTVLVVSLSTLLAWKVNRPVAGMRNFALGLLWICVGSVIGLSRLVIPGHAIMLAGSALLIAGMTITVRGICEFRGLPTASRAGIAAFSAVIGIPFLYWMFVQDDFGRRVGMVSLAMTLLALDATLSLFRRVPVKERVTYWPTAIAFGFSAVFLGIRTVAAFMGYYGADFLTPVPIELPLSVCADIAYVACAFGMLLASNTQMRNAAEKMALFDPLTNLPNRRVLVERLLEAEHRAVENGWQVGVIYMDLDGFKLVNDTLGHDAGDILLRNVSAAMLATIRSTDCLARAGGDEFVVVVEDLHSRGDLTILAERLKAAVESQKIPGGKGTAQMSCGIAVFPIDGDTAHDVMREADNAMYGAKRKRRGASQMVTSL